MAFHVMNPDLVRYLLLGEVDSLTPLHEERMQKIKRTPCPRCGASLHPKLAEGLSVFDPSDPLPRMFATCECGFVQDIRTGMIVDRGSATKVKDPLPIVGKDRDDD